VNFIRSILLVISQIISIIPFAFGSLIWSPLPLRWRYRLTMSWLDVSAFLSRWITGIRPTVIGMENIPEQSVIFLSKHQSTWETLFYPTIVNRELCFVFKREILFIPFFGWGIATMDMIHINRKKGLDSFESIAKQGADKLAQNRSIIMFPEGTRIPSGKTGKYKTGGTRLAVRTGAMVVPIAVNSGRLWPKKPFTKKPGEVIVSFGPAISPIGKDHNELMQEVQQWIETEMRRISPQDYLVATA
jgi:1-acyl-sn-glycerol-3-phosphate acyltransferase